ncbi:hypothetical protein D3C84_1073740 [compost metagenome]
MLHMQILPPDGQESEIGLQQKLLAVEAVDVQHARQFEQLTVHHLHFLPFLAFVWFQHGRVPSFETSL